MAAPEPLATHVEHHPWGTTTRTVRVLAYIDRPGRQQVRIAYDDRIGDDVHQVEFTADRDDVYELPGQDYGNVPRAVPVPRSRGTVPTVHDWRRTG